MCSPSSHNSKKYFVGKKKFRLADFFDQWWDIYKKFPKEYISPEQYKAVNALRLCRTEALGIDYFSCPECGEISRQYHSCNNRFCPTCSWSDTLKWADKIKSKMLSTPHRHVVMTLPHGLNNLIKDNPHALYNLLLRSSAYTIKDWMNSKFNISPGIISVLHTFGETKSFHVHVHMIVSWGGINKTTKLLEKIESDFVNFNFLKDKFRSRYLEELIKLYSTNSLKTTFKDKSSFLKYINSLKSKRWILKLEEPMNIPTQVIRYIGRYSKRACLSEYKITKMDGETIAFEHKNYKKLDIHNKPIVEEIEFNYRDFFPRLLQHVPFKYFRLVRYYAAYANRSVIPKEYLYDPELDDTISNNSETNSETESLMCENCNVVKVYIYTAHRKRLETKITYYKKDFSLRNKVPNQSVA